jgi:hypothetical protein
MQTLFKIALLISLLLFAACGSVHDSSDDNTFPVEVTSPVSNTAQIPKINALIGIESGDVMITWTTCKEALGYELKRADMLNGWYQFYSGIETSYNLGNDIRSGPVYFRVRAVYDSIVSDWSDVMTI